MARTPHYKSIGIYNNRKGYYKSISRAIGKALEEEEVIIDRGVLQPFLIYSLVKTYLRFYNWFTNKIFFKRGKAKFMIYSLDVFCQDKSKEAWKEIKEELRGVISGEYRIEKKKG